jgi:25S rRNA (uracil2634-N3)-methyltransferase
MAKRALPQLQEGSIRSKRRAEHDDYRALCRTTSDGALYAHRDTLCCAAAGCVVCAYRLVVKPSLVAEPTARFRQNARPQECLRVRMAQANLHTDSGGIYGGHKHVLTVGDGDLSFSLALHSALARDGGAVTATTYLSRIELNAAYGETLMTQTIDALRAAGAHVEHGVDATRLGAAPALCDAGPFDRIVFNFPCVASAAGDVSADGQHAEMAANLELMRQFFATAPQLLAPGGELHVAHKTKPPFSHWRLVDLAASQRDAALTHLGRVVFDPANHLGYAPRKVATAGGSFPTGDALVYVWRHAARGARDAAAGEGVASRELPSTIAHGVPRAEPAQFSPDGAPLTARLLLEAASAAGGGDEAGRSSGGTKAAKRRRDTPATAATNGRTAAGHAKRLIAIVAGAHCVRLTDDMLDALCEMLKC